MPAVSLLRMILKRKSLTRTRIFIFLCLTVLGAYVHYSITVAWKDFDHSCPLFHEKGKGGNDSACFLVTLMFIFFQCIFAFIRTVYYLSELKSTSNPVQFGVDIPFRILDMVFLGICIFSSVVVRNGTKHACKNSTIAICDPTSSQLDSFRSVRYGAWTSTALWVAANVVDILKHLVEHVDTFKKIANGEDNGVNDGAGNGESTQSGCTTEMRVARRNRNLELFRAIVRSQMIAQARNGRSRVRTTEV